MRHPHPYPHSLVRYGFYIAIVLVATVGLLVATGSAGSPAAAHASTQWVTSPDAPLITPTPGLCGTSSPQPWRTATSGPITRLRAASASDGQYVYIMGGNGDAYQNNVRLSDVWRWNPDTEAWTRLADMPTAKMTTQGAYWDGKIYVPGGYTNSGEHTAEISIYDIATNTWSVGSPMPSGRSGVASAAFNGKIYAIGGQDAATVHTTTVSIYDIAANTWSQAAPLPRPMSYGRAVTFGSDIYHVAGVDGTAGGYTPASRLLYRYDPHSNVWDQMASLGTARHVHEVMTDGTNIYAVNGSTGLSVWHGLPISQTLEIYNVANNAWSYGNPTTRTATGIAGGFAGGKLMIMGGIDASLTYNTVQVSQVVLGPCPTPGTPVTRTPTPTGTSTPTRTPTRTATGTRTPLPTALPCGGWRHVDAPDGAGTVTFMYDVEAISSTDAWAVGDQGTSGAYRPLTQHWDGASWQIVASPITGTLRGVVAIAADDVWAVGYTGSLGGGHSQTLTMHWNGTDWTVVPSPNITGYSNYLYAVDAGGSNDVWAVGLANSQSLTMRWDGTQWTIIPVPNPTGYALNGVAVAGPGDVWAVGTSGYNTFIAHWDGTTWTQVPSPNPGTYDNDLEAVTAIAPDDVWAVGALANGPTDYHGLAMHWDGAAWEVSPLLGSGENPLTYGIHLHGVAAAATNEVWAVGRDYISSDTASVILRWDGSAWTDAHPPDPGRSINRLYGAAAVAPGEAWAVGNYWSEGVDAYRALTFRYGPQCGSPTATPTQGSTGTAVSTSTAAATSTAASTTTPTAITTATTIVTATVVATATPCAVATITGALTLDDPTQAGRLNTLLAASTCQDPRDCPGVVDIVPRHYDAYSFQNTSNAEACFTVEIEAECLNEILIHSSAYIGSFDPNSLCQNYLADVGPGVLTNSQYSFTVPAGAHFVVVVNELAPNLLCPSYTLSVLGPACLVPGTPQPTSTSIIPTVTLTVPQATSTLTATASAIPTAGVCAIEFSDVQAGSSFYEQVMCLSCMGLISGYSDGTFRPNNQVTRGQLAKLVSNTAGFGDAVTGQSFEDVPEGSTFYMYVERMASRNIIAGYPCGGPGEACSSDNKPYFRLNADATRAQIAKIVSSAARLNGTPTSQTFEDVPPDHTFYLWIERLASEGVMSGYACGSPTEPCGPVNRPYFRPQTNATRGQVAKISGNIFYPGCEPAGR